MALGLHFGRIGGSLAEIYAAGGGHIRHLDRLEMLA
jgi:hypothetical protein